MKFTILNLAVQVISINYIYNVVQPSPLSISRTFSSSPAETLPIKQKLPIPCPYSHPSRWKPPFYFLSLWIWQFYVPHISEIIQYLSFCVWLISLSVMSSRFIPIGACVRISFLFRAEYYSIYIYIFFCLNFFSILKPVFFF